MSKKTIVTSALAITLTLNFPVQAYTPDYCDCTSTDKTEQTLSQEDKALLYLTCGYANLISENYQDAIEDYQKASNLVSNFDNSGMDFLISFGSILACDHLYLSQSAQLHATHIKNIIKNSFQDRENCQESVFQDYHEIVGSLTSLAHTSTSETTKHLLMSFISEIFPSKPNSFSSFTFKHAQLCALHSTHQSI
jgi:hypothetical protein